MNILIVGSGARELAMARASAKSSLQPVIYCYGTHRNPGLVRLCAHFHVASSLDNAEIVKQAKAWHINLVLIGPEAPLAQGLVDALNAQGILSIGPTQKLAQIESSKSFARNLLRQHKVPGAPRYRTFTELHGVKDFLTELGEEGYVIKADGLMGGKGVKVAGDHLHSFAEAYQFCQELQGRKIPFLIEEKFIGQEFSALCFTDGNTLIPMPLVQDNKRAFINDKGPNTGGMGSYSDVNHSLPFLTVKDVIDAEKINQATLNALQEACNEPYRGILYGSFIATKSGVHVIEYNARFGDPEAMNILSLFEGDFVALCHSLALGKLHEQTISFKPQATVCKYVVPLGYPDNPLTEGELDISEVKNKDMLYYAHVEESEAALHIKGSRAIAVVGVGASIAEAELKVEEEIGLIRGPVYHREDIGTASLIGSRIEMMRHLREAQAVL